MKKLTNYNNFIKKLIFTTVFLIALTFISFLYFIQYESFNHNLKTKNEIFVDLIFENLYTGMKNGANINDLDTLVSKLQDKTDNTTIKIHRYVDEVSNQKIKDVFKSKEISIFQNDDRVDFAKPILFSQECLSCHTSASVGEIAGVIQIEMPYLEIDVSMKDILVSLSFLFISSTIIIFLIWYLYFRKIFLRPLEKIVKQMLKINSHNDLDNSIEIKTKIKELKEIEVVFNAQAKKLKKSYTEIEKLSNIDVLTKVFNRKKFIEDAEHFMDVHKRYNQIFTVLLIDLNKFKIVNDTYGHNIGDLVLKEFSISIKNNIRTSDKFYRVGGDEFVVILTNTQIEAANTVINNLKKELKKVELNINGDKLKVSASFGACEIKSDIETIEQLMHIADKEMYKDKLNIKQVF